MGKGRTQQCWQQALDRRTKIRCLGFCKGEAGKVYQEVEANQSRQRWLLKEGRGVTANPARCHMGLHRGGTGNAGWFLSVLGGQMPVESEANSCGFQMLIYSILASWSRWQVWLPWAPFLGIGCKPFQPLWRMVWVCLLKEWHPGIPCSLPLSLSRFCGMLSTLEHVPHAGATAWEHSWAAIYPRLFSRGRMGVAPRQRSYSASQVETCESRHSSTVWMPSRR